MRTKNITRIIFALKFIIVFCTHKAYAADFFHSYRILFNGVDIALLTKKTTINTDGGTSEEFTLHVNSFPQQDYPFSQLASCFPYQMLSIIHQSSDWLGAMKQRYQDTPKTNYKQSHDIKIHQTQDQLTVCHQKLLEALLPKDISYHVRASNNDTYEHGSSTGWSNSVPVHQSPAFHQLMEVQQKVRASHPIIPFMGSTMNALFKDLITQGVNSHSASSSNEVFINPFNIRSNQEVNIYWQSFTFNPISNRITQRPINNYPHGVTTIYQLNDTRSRVVKIIIIDNNPDNRNKIIFESVE